MPKNFHFLFVLMCFDMFLVIFTLDGHNLVTKSIEFKFKNVTSSNIGVTVWIQTSSLSKTKGSEISPSF